MRTQIIQMMKEKIQVKLAMQIMNKRIKMIQVNMFFSKKNKINFK